MILAIYPLFVLGYTWTRVFASDLKGGRNGPLDAYRHALASSIVSYTLGEGAVRLTTTAFESGGRDSNRMDVHNNMIGANIGSHAGAFSELERAVRTAVDHGTVNATNENQITWLPENRWRSVRLW